MELPDSLEDLGLNLLGNLVPHDGLELWLLQADVWEEETLVVWVQLPHYNVLGTKGKKIANQMRKLNTKFWELGPS